MSLAAALILFGCGPDLFGAPATHGVPAAPAAPGATPATDGPVGTVSLPIIAGTAMAKVVVKRNDFVTVPVFDDLGNLIGSQQVAREVWKYVANVDPAAATLPIPAGTGYTVEVVAGDAQTPRQILAYYKSDPFTVAANAPVTPNFPVFDPATLGPSLNVPSIYAGLGSPYDKYSVTVAGLQYPWSSAGWSLTAAGVAPLTRSGATLTFASPARAGAFSFVGKFYLDPSILLAGEGAASWELTKTVPGGTAPTGTVTVIPPQ